MEDSTPNVISHTLQIGLYFKVVDVSQWIFFPGVLMPRKILELQKNGKSFDSFGEWEVLVLLAIEAMGKVTAQFIPSSRKYFRGLEAWSPKNDEKDLVEESCWLSHCCEVVQHQVECPLVGALELESS
uniref:Uncharacterized protein n=1 Tax=Cannabis sativa TaxID=3483 RepID=A0A803PZ23_CANSA